MPHLNQKGVAHLLLLIILILGLIAAVYLITSDNPLKLSSKASNAAVVFKDINGQALPQKNSIPYTTSPTIKIEFTSLLGPPVSVSGPISGSVSAKPSTAGACTPCGADINRDGNVDIKDFSKLSGCFGKKATDTDAKGNSCAAADVNGDGLINISDFSCLRSQFGKKCEQAAPAGTGTVAYRFAESPADLETAAYIPYTQEPMVVTYTFSGVAFADEPGRKFIFVQFKDNTGRTADRSASITLVSPSPTLIGFGKALKFTRGNGYVSAERLLANKFGLLNPKGPMTLEIWFRIDESLSNSENTYLIYKLAEYNYPSAGKTVSALYYLQLYGNRLTVTINDTLKQQKGFVSGALNSETAAGIWHHVAGVYDGQNIKIFIDGKLKGTGNLISADPLTDDLLPLYLQGDPSTFRGVGGGKTLPVTLDEVRISKGARYTGDFTPSLSPFSADNNTLLLWHMDNVEFGSTSPTGNDGIKDESGNGFFGDFMITAPSLVDSTIGLVSYPIPTST